MKTTKVIALTVIAAVLLFAIVATMLTMRDDAYGTYLFSANGREFNISLVASSPSELEKGLMNTTITNNTMMVFVFPSLGIYPFWMENTYSNLDMMWLNVSRGSGSVVYLVRNATSCVGKNYTWCVDHSYTPSAYANYVIEAKAGFAKTNNISVGTRIGLVRKS